MSIVMPMLLSLALGILIGAFLEMKEYDKRSTENFLASHPDYDEEYPDDLSVL